MESFISHTFTASTQVKIGLTVTFTQSISLENYEDAKDKMKTTVSFYLFFFQFIFFKLRFSEYLNFEWIKKNKILKLCLFTADRLLQRQNPRLRKSSHSSYKVNYTD